MNEVKHSKSERTKHITQILDVMSSVLLIISMWTIMQELLPDDQISQQALAMARLLLELLKKVIQAVWAS